VGWALAAFSVPWWYVVALGLGLMFSIFDRTGMHLLEDALLRIIGGSALVGGAGVVASFIVGNFRL
jgi:hypothetical protein